jgi:hypothetical protein
MDGDHHPCTKSDKNADTLAVVPDRFWLQGGGHAYQVKLGSWSDA